MNIHVEGNSIVFDGDEGEGKGQYKIPVGSVDTEQGVLAWVYHLCDKEGIDKWDIKSFIDVCTYCHPSLDVHSKDIS